MSDNYDPTAMLRRGQRVAEVRYQAEVIFRDGLREEPNLNDIKTSMLARRAIEQACHFEAEWMIATMDMREDLPLSEPLTDESDYVAAVIACQEGEA